MIRSRSTEYVRRALPSVKRSGEEIGAALVDALARGEHLRREKARAMEEFRLEEDALGREIAALVREQKGAPFKRHEDIACEVWYDLESGDRLLLGQQEPGRSVTSRVVSRRPMTPQEREEAERLAEELKQS